MRVGRGKIQLLATTRCGSVMHCDNADMMKRREERRDDVEVETGKVQHSRNEHGHGAQISLYVLHFFFATLAHTCTHMHTHARTRM